MAGAPFLEGERLTLRTVEQADHEFLHRYWNDPRIRRGFAWHHPRREPELDSLITDTDTAVHFIPTHDGEPVGFLWLFDIDEVADRGELGYWIAPDAQGNGYGTETVALAIEYAFNDRGLHKLMARVFAWNDPSRRILEHHGFHQEGLLRDHYFVDGAYVDTYLFGLLADEQ
ncbi:MAG: GNAT family protein [Halobacteriales archaeon]|nr:GNAT family protein [Halobacteriales archaeon]